MDTKQAATQLALTKLTCRPDCRGKLAPGKYAVDTTVRVVGTLTVSDDYMTTPTVSIPMKETLALFMANCGLPAELAAQMLLKCMQQSIALDGTGAGAVSAMLPAINTMMLKVENDILAKLPKVPRNGGVRAQLTTTELVTA